MGMIDSHPALKAASPQAPISDWFVGDDLHHNGALFLSQNFGFFYHFAQRPDDPLHEDAQGFHFPTPDGYDFFLRMGPLANADKLYFKGLFPCLVGVHGAPDLRRLVAGAQHPAAPQECPLRRDDRRRLVRRRRPLRRARRLTAATERLNPGITNVLVMGPWAHGEWGRGAGEALGPINFHARTAEFYREKIELPFFRHFLKGDTNYTAAEAQVFETGTDQWRRFDAWPPGNAASRTFYFRPGGSLGFEAPTEDGDAFDEYVSDPAKPVPYTSEASTGYPRSYPVEDQRFAASRPDVLVYETEPARRRPHLRRPAQGSLAGLDHGHRCRLGGEAD